MEAIIHLTRDDVCMLRKITLIESDYYLSYLNINAHNYSSSNFCDGKFLSFMKENFNITKLPYGIKLVDLIISGAKTDGDLTGGRQSKCHYPLDDAGRPTL